MLKVIINKTVLSMLLALAAATSAKSQEMDTIFRHRLYVTYAFNHTDSRDEQASPLLYFGNGNPLGIGYDYRGNSYRHSLRVSFAVSDFNTHNLQPDIQNDPLGRKAFFTNGFLTYSYTRDWGETLDGKLNYSIGGALDNVAFLRIYKYTGGDLYSSGGAATWEELNMLSPVIRADYELNSSERISTELLIPLISLVGRPGYNFSNTNSSVVGLKNFHIVLLGALFGWNYSLTFTQEIWDALLISASYYSRYYRYTRYGWTSSVLMQEAALQLTWRFGL